MAKRKNGASAQALAQALAKITPGEGEDFEWRIRQLEKIQSKLTGKPLYMFSYDIGDNVKHVCPNPTWLLRPRMGRLEYSFWVAEEETLDDPVILELENHWQKFPVRGFNKQNGVKHNVIRLHEDSLTETLAVVLYDLCEEVISQHTSFITRLQTAASKLQVEEEKCNGKSPEKLQREYDNDVRGIIKDAGEHLDAAVACARRFDETECTKDLIAGLRAVIRFEAVDFNKRMKAKDGKPAIVPTKPPTQDVYVLQRSLEQYVFLPQGSGKVRVVHTDRQALRTENELSRDEAASLYKDLKHKGYRDV